MAERRTGMKIKDFAKRMADHGTKPRIRVFKDADEDMMLLVYEGRPDNIDEEIGKLKLNTFTVLGKHSKLSVVMI